MIASSRARLGSKIRLTKALRPLPGCEGFRAF
ncbi:hypothetical protein PPSIR1_36542 [Plesiocystis pacifica SIR-1]|uniref:Uncharacterized protein n=1 Tax=Plesiocystis pacifica SIR-1 TaxID=391625 RepID=A6G1L3_9BACT|nr:hypothetical protein PPSIR1_36542 [Plesiocystis pacifica SIR-1]